MLGSLKDRYFKGLPSEVAVLTAVAFCVALGFGIVAPVLTVFASTFGVSAFAASAVISVFALMRFVGAPLAGWLVNNFGERSTLWAGLSIVAISSAMAGLSQSYVQLLVLRGIGGIGSAMFTVSAMSLLIRMVGPDVRGRAASTYQSGFLIGAIAGPAVGGLVVGFSIRAPFFFYAGTLFLAVLTTVFALPRGLGHPQHADSPEELVKEPQITVQSAMKLRPYRTVLAVNLANGVTSFGLRSSLIPLFVIQELDRGASISSIGFLLTSVAQTLLLLPAGRMTDLRGRKPSLVTGTSILALSMVVLISSQTIIGFMIAMTLMGISGAYLGAAPSAVIGDIVGAKRGGRVVSTYQMTSDLGAVAGPLLAGFLRDSTGGFGWPFAVGLGVALFSVVLTVRMPETKTAT